MRRSNKKRLIPLTLALVLAMVGAALAVPTINVHFQELDAGNGGMPQTVHHAYVDWTLSNDAQYVTSATITLTDDQGTKVGTGSDTVYLIIDGQKYLATYSGSTGVYTVDFTNNGLNNGIPLDNNNLNTVTVVFQGQTVSP
ncbi:hypothetical protein [Thermococcus sp. JdF3]|uniref:hypothetical protein n=1 Tax=Thermococcus sp. JdF3 TaxID=1638258 RepID=UPI00143AE681|nr:hypothetical protein [Thermococcus sp. JdF3]NJE01907.1 hypothetical protein [Thermococcus sp. JdF3]